MPNSQKYKVGQKVIFTAKSSLPCYYHGVQKDSGKMAIIRSVHKDTYLIHIEGSKNNLTTNPLEATWSVPENTLSTPPLFDFMYE